MYKFVAIFKSLLLTVTYFKKKKHFSKFIFVTQKYFHWSSIVYTIWYIGWYGYKYIDII